MTTRYACFRALFALGLAASFPGAVRAAEPETESSTLARAALPATPAPVADLLYARAFTLREPVRFAWAADVGAIGEGMIVVLAVDPAYLVPRAVAEPVLYVGDRPAWRVSHDAASGRVVAIVPGVVDLAATPIFFGAPALPEQIDRREGGEQLRLAVGAGIAPFATSRVLRALDSGGDRAQLAGRLDLLTTTQALIDRYVVR